MSGMSGGRAGGTTVRARSLRRTRREEAGRQRPQQAEVLAESQSERIRNRKSDAEAAA